MRTLSLLSLAVLLASPLACEKSTTQPPSEQPATNPAESAIDPSVDPAGEPDTFSCGGLMGNPCPNGLECADDPADDCDPANGGRDCTGTCVEDAGVPSCQTQRDPTKTYIGESPEKCQVLRFTCEADKEYFADECGCGCAPIP